MRVPGRCLLILWLLGLIVRCGSQGGAKDAVDRVASEFGVPRERVLELGELLGVDPAELDAFGPGHFPYNFYQHQLKPFAQEHGRPPTRSDVEKMVTGYIARCEDARTKRIEYVYYSDKTHPKWTDRELAMVFEVIFEGPVPGQQQAEDPVFLYMRPIDLRDGSVNPSDDSYWEECVEDYLNDS